MRTYPDLFGGETPVAEPVSVLSYASVKIRLHYRRAEGREKCGNCAHRVTHRFGKNYHKCQLLGDTRSSATDIRLSHVCDEHSYGERERP